MKKQTKISKPEEKIIEIQVLLGLLIKEIATSRGFAIMKMLNEKVANL